MLRVKNRGQVVAEIPNRALTDEAPVYHRPMETPAYLADVQRLDLDAVAADSTMPEATDALMALLACAEHREQAVGVPAVRPHGSDQHRQPAWIWCGCGADQGHRSRAGDVGRRQRSLLLPRSETRSDAGGRGSRSQRRMRRRAADRRHELPELRQSGTTADHVAVCARRRRHRRGMPRIERADHRRQRQLV